MKNRLELFLFASIVIVTIPLASYAQKPELYIQTGHTGSVNSVAFSPDGKTLASSSGDKTIKLWDVETRQELRTLSDHSFSVAFSPDSKTLASGGDKTIKIWDITTGRELRTFIGHSSAIWSVAFSPDGKTLASGSYDKTIKIWDVTTGREIRTLTGNSGFVASVAFSPDGKVLAGGGEDKVVKLWEVNTGREIQTFPGLSNSVKSVAFSPDGKTLAGSSYDGIIQLWDVSTGRKLLYFTGHSKGTSSVAFSPDGRTLASSGYDGSIKLWDINAVREIRTLIGDSFSVNSVSFSPDGKSLASGGADNPVRIWDVAAGQELRGFTSHASAVGSVAFSPDGKTLLSVNLSKTVKLWDMASGLELRTFAGHSSALYSVVFSPDGKTMASGGKDKTIKLWNVVTGRELRTFVGHSEYITSITFSPDGKVLASASYDKTIKLWDIGTGRELRTLAGHLSSVRSVAFSPDGKTLASGGDEKIKLWDIGTGQELRTLAGHAAGVSSVAFSPDGKTLASGSWDNTIKLWDIATGKELRTLAGHMDFVNSVTFSPDGKTLASGGDKTIKLWNVAKGQVFRTLVGHSGDVLSVTFSPDGKTLASSSGDGRANLWDVSKGNNLASLIAIDENDWVVVTPDGRFDGSQDGMKLISYIQDNKLIPLDSFFEQFYTPKLLAQVVSGESRAVNQPTADISKGIKLPPLVKITSPKADESYTTDSIQITVEAVNQGGGVDEIRLYQNGKLISDEQRQLVQTAANSKSFNVLLLPGINTFRATAFNKDRTESNPAEIKIELRAAEASSDLYILAIGLNEYKNTKYNLNYGRADAQAFADAAEQHGRNIFRHINKQVILDDQATRKGIEEAFNIIIAQAKPQDAFVFYFAGHGVMSEGDDKTPAEFYLVPYDVVRLYGDDGGLATNGVAARLLKDLCTKVRAQKQLIVLDACQSAGALETFATRGVAEEKAVLQLARSAGVVVLAATGQDQIASEFDKLGHGVFTYALLQALGGDADGSPPDGKVTVTELVAYINDRVPELTKQYRGKIQYPNSWARGQDFPIGVK